MEAPHTAVYGSDLATGDGEPGVGFGGLRGRLPFPIEGRVEIRRSRRPGSDGPGLDMIATPGAVVRAVHGGRVAFADSYADFGPTVIVDHGTGYYTVSAGLGSLEVRVGAEVRPGDRLAVVGSSGGAATLYFEVRKGAVTVDPAPWFGI